MRFFKENSENIIKLFINQIGIAIFSMFMILAAYAISDKGGNAAVISIFISIFSIIFYFVLIYNVAWEIGAKDKIRIDAGRMEKKESKGILLGIYSNIPNFIIIGLAIVLFSIYMIAGGEWLKNIFAILNFIFRFFVSMYLGLIQGITTSIANENTAYLVQSVLFFVFSIISAVVIHVSYILGLKDFRFFPNAKSAK